MRPPRRPVRRGETDDGRRRTPGRITAPPVEKVDALFAKLRAAHDEVTSDPPAEDAPADEAAPDTGSGSTDASESSSDAGEEKDGEAGADGPPEPRHPLAVQRDELIAPIVTGLSRRLKRSLQDSQNDVLDQLRAKGTIWSADLLPDETEQVDSFATSALPFLEEAADAGASLVGNSKKRPSTDALLAIAHDMAEGIVAPLRRRLADGEGLEGAEESVVTEHVGSAFREWKGERIERLAGDHVIAACRSAPSPSPARAASSGWPWPRPGRPRAPTARTTG